METLILDKINEAFLEVERLKLKEKVLVVHPTVMVLIKDRITRYHDISNTRESFVYNNSMPVFLTFKLPKNHYSIMTMAEYKENFSPDSGD